MDLSQWLIVLGLAAAIVGFVVTAFSLNSLIRTSNRMWAHPKKEMNRAISQVLCDEPDYQAAARRIDDIERSYVVIAKGEAYLDLRRLAARRAFTAATDKGASFEDISTRFHRMREVGFYSECSELAILVEFAYACFEYGHQEEGLRVLAQARERFHHTAIDSQSRLPELIEWCGQLLKSIDAS